MKVEVKPIGWISGAYRIDFEDVDDLVEFVETALDDILDVGERLEAIKYLKRMLKREKNRLVRQPEPQYPLDGR